MRVSPNTTAAQRSGIPRNEIAARDHAKTLSVIEPEDHSG